MSIPGEPLPTGTLPATRLIVVQDIYGPARPPRQQRSKDQWPIVPDQLAVAFESLRPGRIAYVRTRRGIKRWQVRLVVRSRALGKNRGRHYLVGMDRNGWCHSIWTDRVLRVETLEEAMSQEGRSMKLARPPSHRPL